MESKDLDHDGKITSEEVHLNLAERKQRHQRMMSWTSLGAMIAFTVMLFTPFVGNDRIDLLQEISSLFYISMASIVGAFMGMSAYMSRK